MAKWLVPSNELSLEQKAAVEISPDSHRVIKGPPGSGKTIVLLHRAKELQQLWRVSPERFHIFVFTNVLKDYIKSALDLLDLPQSCVTTFDYWCVEFFRKEISSSPPWDSFSKNLDYSAIRLRVRDKIRENPAKYRLFDFVMVDEGQDLESISYEILKLISKHITVFMDYKQQLYDRDCSESVILKQLGLRRANMTILGAYRCCPYISMLGAEFVEEEKEKEYFLNQIKTSQSEKEKPLYYLGANYDDEFNRLLDVLKTRINKGEQVGILLHTKRHVFGIAKGIREAGIDIEDQKSLDFNTRTPKIMTYHSAKGLTFDSVFLPRLTESSFWKVTEERKKKIIFVGITRALNWVYMSTTEDKQLPFMSRFTSDKSRSFLVIQKSGEEVFNQSEIEINYNDEIEDDLLDLL